MADSLSMHPFRSISLPSRFNPTPVSIEAQLSKLTACKLSIIENLGAKNIQLSLVSLAKLYVGVEELIRSPQVQQTLLQHQDGEVVKEALNDSVTLLDTCCNAREMLLQRKDHIQTLQSALRRRGGESSIQHTVGTYIGFALKSMKKNIRALKQVECKAELPSPLAHHDHNISNVIRLLSQLTDVSVIVLRSLLLFLSSPAATKTKISACSLISKLVPTGLVVPERRKKIRNELRSVDDALCRILGHVQYNDEMHIAQRKLKAIVISIDGLEAELDCLYRHLIQFRVSLLNVFTH